MQRYCKRLLVLAAAMTLAAGLAGCSSTIHKEQRLDGVDTLSLDAKQRLVLVSHRPNQPPIVCAEPSPDAIVAMSAALAASGSASLPAPPLPGETESPGNNTFSGGGGFSRSESAASIAMRTASIQILRDGYYRLCEGLIGGSIRPEAYGDIVHGIGDFIATAMAIDAAAGTKHAPAVAINGGAVNVTTTPESADVETTGAAGPTEEGQPLQGLLIRKVKAPPPDDTDAQAIRDMIAAYLKHVELTTPR